MSVGGFTAAILAFAVAALVMVALIFTLAAVIGSAAERVGASMRASTPNVKRWGGRILVLVGAWFLVLAAFAPFFTKLFPV